jgi:hypothetical protein
MPEWVGHICPIEIVPISLKRLDAMLCQFMVFESRYSSQVM